MNGGRSGNFDHSDILDISGGLDTFRGVGVLVRRATASDAMCCGFDPCWRGRDMAVDFSPKQSDWLINQMGNSGFTFRYLWISLDLI